MDTIWLANACHGAIKLAPHYFKSMETRSKGKQPGNWRLAE